MDKLYLFVVMPHPAPLTSVWQLLTCGLCCSAHSRHFTHMELHDMWHFVSVFLHLIFIYLVFSRFIHIVICIILQSYLRSNNSLSYEEFITHGRTNKICGFLRTGLRFFYHSCSNRRHLRRTVVKIYI